jgi:hypothetical protein
MRASNPPKLIETLYAPLDLVADEYPLFRRFIHWYVNDLWHAF